MSRLRPLLQFAIPILVLCVALAAPAASADDAVKEDTPAGKAFRDAWWAETGAGKLDQALDGYRTALTAEGSEAVRARALYRMGLVLQRMGRTDEALRAMQRLADEFPGQSALLARAKERLEEWTAVDLRDQFPEWYKRYQYSPEFQAKIVDLVLKLGATDGKTQSLARNELLTIGEPAIPALRQHTGSANRNLARNVNGLLLSLGQLPPAAGLFVETSWYRSGEFWKLLRGADEATQATYRQAAAAQKDDWLPRWVLATIDGPDAMLAELRTAASSGSVLNAVLVPWFADGAASPGFFAALRAMVVDDSVPSMVRSALAYKLMPAFDFDGDEPHPYGLTRDEVLRWARSDSPAVRGAAWSAMGSAYVHGPEALAVAASRVLEGDLSHAERKQVSGAIFGNLRMWADLDGASEGIRAIVKLIEDAGRGELDYNAWRDWGPGSRGSAATPLRAFAAAAGRVRGKHADRLVSMYLQSHNDGIEPLEKFAQLLSWAETAVDGEVRRDAMQFAAQDPHDDVLALTAPISRPEATAGLVRSFFNGMNSSKAAASLSWDAESVTRMVEAANRHFDYGETHATGRWPVAGLQIQARLPYKNNPPWTFVRLLHESPQLPVFFDAAVTFPERFDGDLWYLLGQQWKTQEANRKLLLAALDKGWAQWAIAQRKAGLAALLRDTTIDREDEATNKLLRRLLRSEGNTPDVRGMLLQFVSKLTLEDLRSAFDLSDPEAVDTAAPLLERLPRTREVYDAFVSALRPGGTHWFWITRHFKTHEDDALIADMIARLLKHDASSAVNEAVMMLKRRASAADLPVWIQALTHENSAVRLAAAQMLGRLYDAKAIQALARAVDDPDPNVRDAVLASLEKIKTTEEQKKRWRAFAETGKLPEDDG